MKRYENAGNVYGETHHFVRVVCEDASISQLVQSPIACVRPPDYVLSVLATYFI